MNKELVWWNQEEMTCLWKSSTHNEVINCLQTNMHYHVICVKLGLLISQYELHSYI